MIKFAILLALVGAATAESAVDFNPLSQTDRILKSQATSIEQVPYQVSLQVFGIHICGGSIISERWILTAAHCMLYPPSWYSIRSGSSFSNSGGAVTAAGAVINHELYDSNGFSNPINDITLIFLRSALTSSPTQSPIRLFASGQEAAVGATAVTTGWGTLAQGGSSPGVLHSLTVSIVSKADCNTAHSSVGGISNGQICATVRGAGLTTCQGDSGSPLTINGVLAGIVSWGNGCERPSVYTEIAAYRSWISSICGI